MTKLQTHPGVTAMLVLLLNTACPSVAARTPSVSSPAILVNRRGTDPTTFIPGVPNRPDLVTVVPFYWKPNETEREQTKVVIPAEIDGHRSIFIVDIGCSPLILNRTFLQPSPTGGIDTVTDANRIRDTIQENDLFHFDRVHVQTVRIGTFKIAVEDTGIDGGGNALLGHEWGNFSWVFSPRLGNIGLSVLAQFETIIDYTHRRLVLIRLDSAGHRLVDVPAYTPRWSAPLLDLNCWNKNRWCAWGVAVAVRPEGLTLDTLQTAKNTRPMELDTGAPTNWVNTVGYPFLHSLGVVGFNHRTHQVILYR